MTLKDNISREKNATSMGFAKTMVVISLTACGCASTPTIRHSPQVSTPHVSIGCVPQRHEASLFMHDGFGGQCVTLGLGDYQFPERTGLPNDSVSSILVGDGSRVLVCRERAFGGACAYFEGPIAELGATSIGNDMLSSLRVERRPDSCIPGPNQIALYSQAAFIGDCSVLGIGDYLDSSEIGIGNDSVSSVRLGSGVQAMLCRHDGFGEPCERAEQDISHLRDHRLGDDAISSVRIVRAGSDCIVRGADERFTPHTMTIEAICAHNYPRIIQLLATDSLFSPPYVISFTRLARYTGEARGRDVYIDEVRWHFSDLGMIDHELTHIVTMYPSAPSWITEGVADYVRAELGGPTGWDDYHCRGNETYRSGYGCAAALFRFAEHRSPGAIRELHARLRTQSFDGYIADSDVDSLWTECLSSGYCAAR